MSYTLYGSFTLLSCHPGVGVHAAEKRGSGQHRRAKLWRVGSLEKRGDGNRKEGGGEPGSGEEGDGSRDEGSRGCCSFKAAPETGCHFLKKALERGCWSWLLFELFW